MSHERVIKRTITTGHAAQERTPPRVEWNSLKMLSKYIIMISMISASFTGIYVIYRPTRRIFLPVLGRAPPVTRLFVCQRL